MTDFDDNKILSVLLSEYQRTCGEIKSIESNNEKIVGFGLTIISAAFVSGLSQDISEVHFIIPPAVVGVLLYGMMTYCNVFSLAGYKRYLEDEINLIMERNILVWEQLVIEREKWNASRIGLMIVYFSVTAALISVSIIALVDHYGWYWAGAMIAFVVVLFVFLFLGATRLGVINENTYIRAKILSKIE